MDSAKYLLNAEGSSLLLTERETGDLIFDIVIGDKGDVIKGEKVPKGKGIAGLVAETHQPIVVDDVKKDRRFFDGIDKISKFITKSILCVPMIVMGEFVGVLEIVNAIGRDCFDEWDLQKAQYVADQAAVAINNRRLYDDLMKRIDEITSLYEVSQSISFSGSEDDLLQNILNSLSTSMGARRASIFLHDPERQRLSLKASVGLPEQAGIDPEIRMSDSVTGYVFQNGDPMIVTDIRMELPSQFKSPDRNYSTHSFISLPIMHQKKTIGVISLADKKNTNNFDSYDLRVLSTVSSQIAEIYQNLLNQKHAEDRKRLAREIDIAAEIQKKILPVIPESLNGHRLAAFNRPAKEIGGDFYDFFKFDNNKFGLLVADVSGKGIPAALFMGTARNVVRAETRIDRSPARLLKNANYLIYQDSESGMFVTLFYVVVDSHNSIFTYGNAGHNTQLLIKNSGKIITLSAKGKALGLVDIDEYEERVQFFEQGDLLLLFTDGIIEHLSGESLDIEHGEEKLINIALRYKDRDPVELIDYIKLELEKDSVSDEVRDDLTVFALKF